MRLVRTSWPLQNSNLVLCMITVIVWTLGCNEGPQPTVEIRPSFTGDWVGQANGGPLEMTLTQSPDDSLHGSIRMNPYGRYGTGEPIALPIQSGIVRSSDSLRVMLKAPSKPWPTLVYLWGHAANEDSLYGSVAIVMFNLAPQTGSLTATRVEGPPRDALGRGVYHQSN